MEELRTQLQNGLNPNAYVEAWSQLYIHRDNFDCFKLLLEHGADPNKSIFSPDIPIPRNPKPLEHFCLEHSEEFVKALMEHGADVNAVDEMTMMVIKSKFPQVL